jgi:hypothetical protein
MVYSLHPRLQKQLSLIYRHGWRMPFKLQEVYIVFMLWSNCKF